MLLGHVRLLLVASRLGLVRVQLVPTIHSIVSKFATHSAHWNRLLFHWGAVARTLGTRCIAAVLSRERLDLSILGLGILGLGSRL
jgi:hypothetical protein